MVLQMDNTCKKKFPLEIFRWYISIGDSGICSNFFKLSEIYRRIYSVCIPFGKSQTEVVRR